MSSRQVRFIGCRTVCVDELELRRAIIGKDVTHRTFLATHVIRQDEAAGPGLLEVGDFGVAQRSQIGTNRLGSRLRIDLSAALGHFTEEAAVEVRVFLGRVIVVIALFVLVPVQ